MVKNITLEHSCQIRTLYQISGVHGKALLNMFPQYSKAQIYVHARKPINGEPVFDRRKINKGRPRIFLQRDLRNMVRTIPTKNPLPPMLWGGGGGGEGGFWFFFLIVWEF